ncbi:MAG: hypothetical protein JXA69_12605 [Phycisphaerae bacterium]|nr:hypothetical protein [Phycisphaerae bacterium]
MSQRSLSAFMATLYVICAVNMAPAADKEPIHLFDLAAMSPGNVNDPLQRVAAWELAHAVATLQGIVNRNEPRLYVRYVVSPESAYRGNVDDYWLEKLRREGQWLADRDFQPIPSLEALVATFSKDIQGVVVYDPQVPATSNVASTVAGAERLIAVRFNPTPGSVHERLIRSGPRLPVRVSLLRADGQPMFTGRGEIPDIKRPSTGSAKCDAYLWAKAKYLDTGRCDGQYLGYYPDAFWLQAPHREPMTNHLLTNHDFFVSKKAFFCDLHVWGDEAPIDDPRQKPGTDLATFREILLATYHHGGGKSMTHVGGFTPWTHKYTVFTGGGHEDVATEWETVRLVSAYNGFIDADAPGLSAMANASFFTHYPLEKRYRQHPWPTTGELRRRGLLDAEGHVVVKGRQYWMVYVGDYDAAAWLYQRVPDMWDHPARGQVPLNWAVSPVLERRVPVAMAYMRETATKNDFFITSDNGAGYLLPGMLQEPRPISGLPDGLDAWARHCDPFYYRWDLTITGFIIEGHGPPMNRAAYAAYRRFSPDGIVPQSAPPAMLFDDMPVLRPDHDLVAPDPAVAARYALERIRGRDLPFHWFRVVLRNPEFYRNLNAELSRLDSRTRMLDAPTFFELLRRYLSEHPEISEKALGRLAAPATTR